METDSIRERLNRRIRPFANLHVQGSAPNVFIFSTPRSGSTWLMETIAADRRMKPCNEPFNIRKPDVASALGIRDWDFLESTDALPLIERYLDQFRAGRLRTGFKNLRPFEKGYRAFTDRIVFKVLHACENRIGWLRSRFNAQTVYLIRHPAPVSLSRTELPRLRCLVETRLAGRKRELARTLLDSGSPLEQATLDWCLQNKPILEDLQNVDLVVTYEQMVMEPDVIVDRLISVLNLKSPDAVRRSVDALSRSVAISDDARLELLERRHQNPADLVTGWQRSVTEDQLQAMDRVLQCLGVNAYSTEDPWPASRFWIRPAEARS